MRMTGFSILFCIICRIDYKKQLIITETTAQTNVGCPTGLKRNTRSHLLFMVCGPRGWGRKSMKGEVKWQEVGKCLTAQRDGCLNCNDNFKLRHSTFLYFNTQESKPGRC